MAKDSNHRAFGKPKTRFARLDHDLLRSAAYRALTPNGRALLVELAMMFNTKNNGELYLSVRDAADRMGLFDPAAANNAFAELMDLGFIDIEAEGTFSSRSDKVSKARCWRVTWAPCKGKPATFDYRGDVVRGGRAAKRARTGRLALDRYERGKNRGKESYTETAVAVQDTYTGSGNNRSEAPPTVQESYTGNSGSPRVSVVEQHAGIPHTYSYTTTGGLPPASETACVAPETPAGQLAASSAPVPKMHLDYLRRKVRSALNGAEYGAAKRLALEAGVPAATLSKFKNGGGLPQTHFVRLQVAMRQRETREAA